MRIPALGILTVVMVLTSIVSTSMVSTSVPALAQTYSPGYPICMYAYRWGGSDVDCSYATLAQCAASASGRGATCMANPYFANAQMPGEPNRRHRRVYQ